MYDLSDEFIILDENGEMINDGDDHIDESITNEIPSQLPTPVPSSSPNSPSSHRPIVVVACITCMAVIVCLKINASQKKLS